MKKINSVSKVTALLFFSLFIAGTVVDTALAQRVSYEALKARDRVPTAYFDYNVIPPASPGENQRLIVSFKIEYNFLTFRTVREEREDGSRFFADVEIGIDVFSVENRELSRQEREELHTDRMRETAAARQAEEASTRQGSSARESISRGFWNGTAYASTYEQTQSSNEYLEGYIVRELPPGEYEVTARFSSNQRTRNTNPRRVNIPEDPQTGRARLYFLDETSEIDLPATSPLINMGRNVYYGKDFNALVLIPSYEEQADYRLQIKRLEVNRRDTTTTTIYDEVLEENDIHPDLNLQLAGDDDGAVIFDMASGETGHSFGLKHIPNSSFENAQYRIELWKTGNDDEPELLGSRMFVNRWVDIPTSLLNVDVAINMMRFIVDDETLSNLQRGSEQQRERKFREFWQERNPTPETEYNELMVEYYRRIDYAFENFTSPRVPGYESDMGKVYIRNGAPRNVTRRLPPNQPAIQVWEYSNRSFVFAATSGFGEYELRETRQN